MAESLPSLTQVIGQNVRRLRGDHTLEELAAHGRPLGATWSAASVRAIERGEFRATVETVVLLALALDALDTEGKTAEGTITSRDLFSSGQSFTVGSRLISTTNNLVEFLGGGTSGTALDMNSMAARAMEGMGEWVSKMKALNLPNRLMSLHEQVDEAGPETPAEKRLAKKIGVDVYELRSWSVYLWGKSFEDHRDDVAGPGTTPQKKGRISRELLDEIQSAMRSNHGDD